MLQPTSHVAVPNVFAAAGGEDACTATGLVAGPRLGGISVFRCVVPTSVVGEV